MNTNSIPNSKKIKIRIISMIVSKKLIVSIIIKMCKTMSRLKKTVSHNKMQLHLKIKDGLECRQDLLQLQLLCKQTKKRVRWMIINMEWIIISRGRRNQYLLLIITSALQIEMTLMTKKMKDRSSVMLKNQIE